MVVITHNVLTNADHVPTAETTMQVGELLIEDTPAILSEAARLSEEAILRQVIDADEEEGETAI